MPVFSRPASTLILLLAACGLSACSFAPPEPTAELRPGLLEIPEVALETLEPAVREQLQDAREQLDSAVADPSKPDSDLASVYGQVGMVYHAYGEYEAAAACYANAATLQPTAFRWPYYRAHVAQARGNVAEAIQGLRRALDLRPVDVPSLVHLARLERDSGRADGAKALFERAVELDAGTAAAWAGLGRIAADGRDFATAVTHFEKALEIQPAADALWYPLSQAYAGAGDDDKAGEALSRRGEQNVTLADLLMQQVTQLRSGWRVRQNLGSQLFRAGNYERAREEFLAAVAEAPEQPVIHINLGSAYAQLKQLDQAVESFKTALELDPNNEMGHVNLGTVYAEQGEDTLAIEHYRKALEISPNNLKGHFNLANALRRVGEFTTARRHYRAVINQDPGNGPARQGEAFALLRLHEYEEALELLEEGHQLLPTDETLQNALARVLASAPDAKLRDGQRAVELARQLVERQSALHNVEALAMALAEAGDFETARHWQSRALQAIEATGDEKRIAPVRRNLELFERNEPCRRPWADDDPVLSPGNA